MASPCGDLAISVVAVAAPVTSSLLPVAAVTTVAPPASTAAPSFPPTTSAATSPARATPLSNRYYPFDHPRAVVTLEVSAFALVTAIGVSAGSASAGSASTGSASDSSGAVTGGVAASGAATSTRSSPARAGSKPATGTVVSSGVDNTYEGWEGFVAGDAAFATLAAGDRSWTWRWPGTSRIDRLSLSVPVEAAPWSPLVSAITNDAGYLRAMFGSAGALLPLAGLVLGALAVDAVGGRALPPPFGLAMALAVLGVADAFAGFLGVTVFVAGVVALGGLNSFDAARTLLGLSALWFVAPIVAGTYRPLRRTPTTTAAEHVERLADFVVASLVGAWSVLQICRGLPGLSGMNLPIANRAPEAAIIVLAALSGRLIVETIAAHCYPRRLAAVQPPRIPGSGLAQHVWGALVTVAIVLFVAVAYLGSCWQLYVGGALFLTPLILRVFRDRLPNVRGLFAVLPRGGVAPTVVMLVVGTLFGAVVVSHFHNHRELVRDSFVLLSLPGLVLTILGMFGRDGPRLDLRWYYQSFLGALAVAFCLLFVLGVITV